MQTTSGFGQTIRTCRTRLGLSQDKVARSLGVTRAALNRWENERAMPTPEHMAKLVEHLDIRIGPIRASESQVHQLLLPFDPPINVELRLTPQRADTIQFLLQLKDLAG